MVYTDDADRRPDHRVRRRRRRRSGALLSLTDDEVEELARHALTIEEHYGRPMDIEWGKDGVDGELYILQARPETVQSRGGGRRCSGSGSTEPRPTVLVEGRAIGQKIGAGAGAGADLGRPDARVQRGRGAGRRHDRPRLGADHEAGLARSSPTAAAAPATPRSSPASSASPPWSAPARRPRTLADGREVTVSCAEGDTGFVYDGLLDFTVEETELDEMPDIPVKIMMNVGTPGPGVRVRPAAATRASGWPGSSSSSTGRSASTPRRCSTSTTPRTTPAAAPQIDEPIAAYPGPREFFVQRVAEGVVDARGGVRAAPGDRADVGLQVQRVRQPASAASCTSRTRRTR